MSQFNEEFERITSDLEDISAILASRSGSLSDRLVFTEPRVDLHTLVHALTPREVHDAVNVIVEKERFTLKLNTFTHYLVLVLQHGTVLIETATPQFAWDENSATEDLLISLTFSGMMFNDLSRLNKLNNQYPTLQISVSENGVIKVRSHQTLKGGRTIENLLWTLIHFIHDTERLHRDIIF